MKDNLEDNYRILDLIFLVPLETMKLPYANPTYSGALYLPRTHDCHFTGDTMNSTHHNCR